MLTVIIPKLPMRDRARTRHYYINHLGFHDVGTVHYDEYLLVARDGVELHFFLHPDLDPRKNYGQVYLRVNDIDALYNGWMEQGVRIHPHGALNGDKPWGQREFALLDPDHNLLTFGQAV
jgi:catechol 2,3-dioxygenase-like lactoylglutathione lyase family enzyme